MDEETRTYVATYSVPAGHGWCTFQQDVPATSLEEARARWFSWHPAHEAARLDRLEDLSTHNKRRSLSAAISDAFSGTFEGHDANGNPLFRR